MMPFCCLLCAASNNEMITSCVGYRLVDVQGYGNRTAEWLRGAKKSGGFRKNKGKTGTMADAKSGAGAMYYACQWWLHRSPTRIGRAELLLGQCGERYRGSAGGFQFETIKYVNRLADNMHPTARTAQQHAQSYGRQASRNIPENAAPGLGLPARHGQNHHSSAPSSMSTSPSSPSSPPSAHHNVGPRPG